MSEFIKKSTSDLSNLNIGIIGCGWLGIRMAKKLCGNNNIYTTTTSTDKIPALEADGLNPILVDLSIDPTSAEISQWKAISVIDVLIITVPFFSRKGNAADTIGNKVPNLSTFIGNFTGQIFFTSSTGVYPQEEKIFIEEDMTVENVLPEFLLKERFAQANILRLGGLLGDQRQLGNYDVPNVDAPVNHIHYEDACGVIEKMIQLQLHSRVYNVVAPHHPTKREVISAQKIADLGAVKKEMQRVISPQKMISELEYDFKYPDPRYFHV